MAILTNYGMDKRIWCPVCCTTMLDIFDGFQDMAPLKCLFT